MFQCLDQTKPGAYPKLTFQFEGAAMMLPWTNLIMFDRNLGAKCLAIVTDHVNDLSGGPAVILGNHRQHDF